jgi:RNA polymerase subunit RPABC4/transcription elongation factor Spt4
MEEIIARAVQVLLALGGAYLVALWFVLVVWTFRDIEARSRSVLTQVFSTLLVVLFFVPGVLLYLILRPKETLDAAFQRSLEEEYLLQDLEELPVCRSCQRYVEDDFMLCPHCQTQLREPCTACARLIDMRWTLCPYCGTEQAREQGIAAERVPEPAVRWVAPTVIRRKTAKPAPAALPVPPADEHVAAMSVSGEAPAAPSPVRLFDRRKTRETARFNSIRRTGVLPAGVAGNGNGGHLVDRFGRSLDGEPLHEVVVTGDGNGRGNIDPMLTRVTHATEETGD